MVASRETLRDLATERQLQPATLEHVIRLVDILDAFGADTMIGPRIALKGGTALNVFHSDLDRLSVDIDVNYVGAIEKERMEVDRPGLEDRIELMQSKGYTARREPSEHAGGKWIYRYALALGGAGTIEIDINYLFRSPPSTVSITCRRHSSDRTEQRMCRFSTSMRSSPVRWSR